MQIMSDLQHSRFMSADWARSSGSAANLHVKILDFRGLDSSRSLILRGGIPRPIGDFLESLSQSILLGMILVGRLGV